MKDLNMIFSTDNGLIDFEKIDLSDIEDVTIENLQSMDSQMNNGRLDISRELRRRGK